MSQEPPAEVEGFRWMIMPPRQAVKMGIMTEAEYEALSDKEGWIRFNAEPYQTGGCDVSAGELRDILTGGLGAETLEGRIAEFVEAMPDRTCQGCGGRIFPRESTSVHCDPCMRARIELKANGTMKPDCFGAPKNEEVCQFLGCSGCDWTHLCAMETGDR